MNSCKLETNLQQNKGHITNITDSDIRFDDSKYFNFTKIDLIFFMAKNISDKHTLSKMGIFSCFY